MNNNTLDTDTPTFLSFDAYEQRAMKLAIYPYRKNPMTSLEVRLTYPALKLAGEAGEVAEKIGKLMRDGLPKEVTPYEWRQNLEKELGDVLWYVAAIATEIGSSLQDVAKENLKKLEGRAARGTLKGSGDDR